MEELLPGHRLGEWTVMGLLGQGGSGAVYRVRPSRGVGVAAAKVLHAPVHADTLARSRFERETRVLSGVDHAGISRLLDAFVEGERMVLISELVAGRPLSSIIGGATASGSGMPPRRVVRVAAGIARGLESLHRAGLLHRDLKPANIIVDARDHARLVDFGLARLMSETTIVTDPGRVRATLRYTAPEVLLKQSIGPAADLYALGLVIHEMLLGSPAIAAKSLAAIATAQIGLDPAPVTRRRPELPSWWDRLIAKLTAKEPSRRYASAEELLSDLDELGEELAR